MVAVVSSAVATGILGRGQRTCCEPDVVLRVASGGVLFVADREPQSPRQVSWSWGGDECAPAVGWAESGLAPAVV